MSSGVISSEDGSYSISTFGHGLAVMYEMVIPESKIGNEECSECDGVSINAHTLEVCNIETTNLSSTDCMEYAIEELLTDSYFEICTVDIGIAFTQSSARETEVIEAAEQITAQMNEALRNSKVFNLVYRLVGVEVLPTFQIPDNILPSDARSYALVSDAANDGEIHNFRNRIGADQILLVVQSTAFRTKSFGISELVSAPQVRDLAIMEVNSDWRYSGPHELSHNHGCKHEGDSFIGTAGQSTSFAQGYRITSKNATIHGFSDVNQGGSPLRVPYFSNPDVEYLTAPTGTLNANNAQQLRNSACFMAKLHGESGLVQSGVIMRASIDSRSSCGGELADCYVYVNDCDPISID